jgi:lysophospholipase L1-like esterase
LIRLSFSAVLVVLLGTGLERLLDHYYYSQTYRYYQATEVYWEDQHTLLLYLPHRDYFWSLKPDIRLHVAESITEYGVYPELNQEKEYLWDIEVNSAGFRASEFNPRKPDEEIRIVCLGDSRTLGEGLTKENTYSSQLENQLRSKKGNNPTRVINLGMDGWSSHQGLTMLTKEVISYRPDAAIFCFGINDTDTWWAQSDEARSNQIDTPITSIRRFMFRSMIAYWIHRQFLRTKGFLMGKSPIETKGVKEGIRRVPVQKYTENLRQFIGTCRDAGILPILLTMPVNPYYNWAAWATGSHHSATQKIQFESLLPGLNGPEATLLLEQFVETHATDYEAGFHLASYYREAKQYDKASQRFSSLLDEVVFTKYNRAAVSVAREMDCIVVDLSPTFLQISDDNPFIDDLHPSISGSKLIASALADSIRTHLGLRPN